MFLVTQLQQGIKNDFEIDCFCCCCSKSSSLFLRKKKKEIVGMYSLVSLVSQIWIQTVVLL